MTTYEEQESIDLLQYLEDGQIQIRKATRVLRDGVEISKQYHRHVVAPGQDLSDQDPKVRQMAESMWTAEVIEAFKAKQRELAALVPGSMGNGS